MTNTEQPTVDQPASTPVVLCASTHHEPRPAVAKLYGGTPQHARNDEYHQPACTGCILAALHCVGIGPGGVMVTTLYPSAKGGPYVQPLAGIDLPA